MWTISDFPAYANLSGWSTKGKTSCPCCNENTRSRWLSNGRKFCYMGHRRFLPMSHRFQEDKCRLMVLKNENKHHQNFLRLV